MKTFKLEGGDLVIGSGGFTTVRGSDKLQQDLGAIVREELGTDRFHPRWGTVLHRYIGRPIDRESAMYVKGEINRLLQNYMMVQTNLLQADATAGHRPRFTPSEVISAVREVSVQQRRDYFNIKVTVRTFAGADVTILRTVGL